MRIQTLSKLAGLLATGLTASLSAAPLVYIPLGAGNGVVEVDASTDKIINHFEGVENSHGLVATPDGEYLIAGSLYEDNAKVAKGDKLTSDLFLLHPAHGHVMQTIAVEGWSHHLAITPDGRYVLSTHPTKNQVSVVDIDSGLQIKTIPTGNAPYYVRVTSDGKRAYVSNSGSANIQEIDTQSWTVIRTIDAGPSPEHMVLSKDEKILFVNNARKGTVSAIPLDKPDQRKIYEVGASLHGLDISDDGKRLFISSKSEGKLVALDYQSGKQQVLPLSPKPYHLNTITGTGKVYISSRSTPSVWVVDQQSLQVLNTIDLPAGEGHQMAIVQ
ncbi:MAG: beta-propeller fold lactonase family protein [Halopseudomonas sp.]